MVGIVGGWQLQETWLCDRSLIFDWPVHYTYSVEINTIFD